MNGQLPRDRWVGASPDGNVTPGGIALEYLSKIAVSLGLDADTPPSVIFEVVKAAVPSARDR